jgi:glutaredoxin
MIESLVRIVPLVALAAVLPVQAQYKVVSPDGRVTYTDTPPAQSGGAKVTKLGENQNVVPQAALPLELRQATSRFPVTLYTMKVCEPCDTARQLLRQRGVPFSEKLIISAEDGDALQRITGGRDAPSLTIGSQVLRGLVAETWNGYLDVAGYPRESRLPPNYQYPAATPLVEPPTTPVAAERRAPEQPTEQRTGEPASPSGIRF